VKRNRIEDSSREGETSGPVEQRGTLASEVFVTGGDEWEAIGNRDFVEGKGEAKVGLGERGDNSTKTSSKGMSSV
jgi:hypothetical protein